MLRLSISLIRPIGFLELLGDESTVIQVCIERMTPNSLLGQYLFANDTFMHPGRNRMLNWRVVNERTIWGTAFLELGC